MIDERLKTIHKELIELRKERYNKHDKEVVDNLTLYMLRDIEYLCAVLGFGDLSRTLKSQSKIGA